MKNAALCVPDERLVLDPYSYGERNQLWERRDGFIVKADDARVVLTIAGKTSTIKVNVHLIRWESIQMHCKALRHVTKQTKLLIWYKYFVHFISLFSQIYVIIKPDRLLFKGIRHTCVLHLSYVYYGLLS